MSKVIRVIDGVRYEIHMGGRHPVPGKDWAATNYIGGPKDIYVTQEFGWNLGERTARFHVNGKIHSVLINLCYVATMLGPAFGTPPRKLPRMANFEILQSLEGMGDRAFWDLVRRKVHEIPGYKGFERYLETHDREEATRDLFDLLRKDPSVMANRGVFSEEVPDKPSVVAKSDLKATLKSDLKVAPKMRKRYLILDGSRHDARHRPIVLSGQKVTRGADEDTIWDNMGRIPGMIGVFRVGAATANPAEIIHGMQNTRNGPRARVMSNGNKRLYVDLPDGPDDDDQVQPVFGVVSDRDVANGGYFNLLGVLVFEPESEDTDDGDELMF